MKLGDRTSRGVLVGRDEELAAGLAALAGPASVVLIQGPPGIGKSALSAELARRVAGRWRSARGAARELETGQPFAVLVEAVGALTTIPDTHELGSVEAWLGAIDRVAAGGPTMLVLEDLHWADVGTLAVLARLSREHESLPVAILATARSTPRRPEVDAWVASMDGSARVLELAPMTPDAVTELVTHRVGRAPGPALQEEVRRAGGNPEMVRELLAGMQAADALHPSPHGTVELVGEGWTGTVATSVLSRMGFLSADARALLTQCAVLGGRFPVAELVALTGRSTSELLPTVEELDRAGLVTGDGDRLRFSHDLVREAVYEALPIPVRLSSHEDAARRLGAAGASPVVVAEHLLRAVQEGDASAVDRLRSAAQRVLDQAPGLAIALLDAALQRVNPMDASRRELAADRAGALLAAGRLLEAITVCRGLLDTQAGSAEARACGRSSPTPRWRPARWTRRRSRRRRAPGRSRPLGSPSSGATAPSPRRSPPSRSTPRRPRGATRPGAAWASRSTSTPTGSGS